jgi:hydrogenase maturation protein HypF
MNAQADSSVPLCRVRVTIRGAVQGVGFRPFIFRLANELGLTGWVKNSAQGVFVEAEAQKAKLDEFLRRLAPEKPLRSSIQSMESAWLDMVGYSGFVILESDEGGPKTAFVMPDIATCPDCLTEIFDRGNRRYLYPFTNCTNCGPRFSILEALPYDRANTSMKRFTMCPQCQREYDDPSDRRFHAQPNACPVCGPHLELWDPDAALMTKTGASTNSSGEALDRAVQAIQSGRIVAVKGLGGFHLVVRADSDDAVHQLRSRKHREEKPFAVMFPSMETVRSICQVSPDEERSLLSPEAPILLLRRLKLPTDAALSFWIAPGNPYLGVMLPYTPLHHMLLASLRFPIVATSGNLSDEPICTDEREALERLRGIADLFLVHNRPIVRHVDDSIVRSIAGREQVLRRARGFAPLPIQVRTVGRGERNEALAPVLAVGADLKSAVALGIGPQVFISQHIGDLETAQAYEAFRRVTADLQKLYDSPASFIMTDAHPDYISTRFAQAAGLPCRTVQHHVAHVLACMAENDLEPPALGVSWDGTGYGLDGTVWGGEFLQIKRDSFERVAHFRQFPLPGGEHAIREPRRASLGLLFETFGEAVFERSDLGVIKTFSSPEKSALKSMLMGHINSPLTSSVGRLFDAVASLVGLRQKTQYEGQAAMELEFRLADQPDSESAAYDLHMEATSGMTVLDWRPAVESIIRDLRAAVAPSIISIRFHNMLVESVLKIARRIGLERVVLSGGCFQNRYLAEQVIRRLGEEGFRAYWHQRVPPNDGGICLGQVVAARWWKV